MSAQVSPEQISFENFKPILKLFGIDDIAKFNQLSKEQKLRLKQILQDLQDIMEAFKEEKLSRYAIINWMEVLLELENEENFRELLFSLGLRFANGAANSMDKTMTWVYLGLNLAGLIISAIALQNPNLAGSIANHQAYSGAGHGWNYLDSLGGVVLGIRQIKQGEWGLGFANLFGSAQLTAFTIPATIAQYAPHLVKLTPVAIGAFMSFSFAACMAISGGIEYWEAHKCEQRITKLTTKLSEVEDELNSDAGVIAERKSVLEQKKLALQKAILIEKANYENHIRSAKAWAGCAGAMMLIAAISIIALSGLTFGALPAATVIISATAVVSGLIRAWWVKRKDHVKNVKDSIKSLDGEKNRLEKLNTCLEQIKNKWQWEVNKEVEISGKKISFRSYLEDLLVKDPQKFEFILTNINNGIARRDEGIVVDALKRTFKPVYSGVVSPACHINHLCRSKAILFKAHNHSLGYNIYQALKTTVKTPPITNGYGYR